MYRRGVVNRNVGRLDGPAGLPKAALGRVSSRWFGGVVGGASQGNAAAGGRLSDVHPNGGRGEPFSLAISFYVRYI